MPALNEDLIRAVGVNHVLTDPGLREGYERDWTGRFGGEAACVVRPADTAQVAAVLAACRAHGAALVPQGGNTGLVGAGVPRGGEVLLSLARLDAVGEVDAATAQVSGGRRGDDGRAPGGARARPASTPASTSPRATRPRSAGWWPATPAAPGRWRTGRRGRSVAGLEAVLADGTVVERMHGLLKDNAGTPLARC